MSDQPKQPKKRYSYQDYLAEYAPRTGRQPGDMKHDDLRILSSVTSPEAPSEARAALSESVDEATINTRTNDIDNE